MAHASHSPGEALHAAQHVLSAVRGAVSPEDAGHLHHLEANTLLWVGRTADALPEYRRAFSAFRKAENRREAGRVTIGWTFAQAIAGNPREAKRIVTMGRRILPANDVVGRARLEGNLGTAWHHAGRLDDAVIQYDRARRTFDRAGESEMAASCRHNAGLVAILIGETRRARVELEAARRAFARSRSTLYQLYAETGLAELAVREGRWDEALAAIEELRARFDELGDERASAWLCRELARLFTSIGAVDAAEPEAAAARRAFLRLGIEPEAAHVAFLEGRLALAAGATVDAIERIREAKRHWERVGNDRAWHRASLEEARALLAEGRITDALAVLRPAGEFLRRVDPRGDGALGVGLEAECALELGEIPRGIRLARAAFAAARRHPAHLERPHLALLVAGAEGRGGDSRAAIAWSRRAVREHERLLSRFGRRHLRVLVGGSRESIVHEAVDLLLEHGGAGAERVAVDVLARARSPILVEDVLQSESASRASRTVGAITRLRDEILAGPSKSGAGERDRLLSGRIARLERRLASETRRSPALARRATRVRGFDAWLRLLGTRDLVLYDRSRSGWRAFVVHGDGRIDHVELGDAAGALQSTWPSLRILLETAAAVPKSRRADFLERTRPEAIASLERLRAALWRPLPIESDRVIVVPFADLHGVPLEGIASSSDVVVTRLPHPALLRKDRPRRRARALLLHGGDDEARREVSDIARLLRRAGTTVRLGSRRSALIREREPLGILHVAAHGAFHLEGWLRSGIRLRDGWLGFERLRPHQLRGALVQFMSCESGQSRRLPGSDLEGWTTAALAAGARELVLTLWKVDGEWAGSFARAFYRRWITGRGAAEACHEARLELSAGNAHPFLWAPFIAVG